MKNFFIPLAIHRISLPILQKQIVQVVAPGQPPTPFLMIGGMRKGFGFMGAKKASWNFSKTLFLFAVLFLFQMLFQHQIDVLGEGAVILLRLFPKLFQKIAIDRYADSFL